MRSVRPIFFSGRARARALFERGTRVPQRCPFLISITDVVEETLKREIQQTLPYCLGSGLILSILIQFEGLKSHIKCIDLCINPQAGLTKLRGAVSTRRRVGDRANSSPPPRFSEEKGASAGLLKGCPAEREAGTRSFKFAKPHSSPIINNS